MVRAALRLARLGLPILPCAQAGKIPACAHGVKDATTDADQIRKWWDENPDYNIAIATGTRIFAVDVDSLDAESELHRLEQEHGTPLPPTVETITPRGRHLYFEMPDMPVRNSASRLARGVDVRATGGYCLVPPSIVNGRRYTWSVDCAKTFAAAPTWLLELICERGNGKAVPPSEWRALVSEGVDEGQRDCTVAKLTGHLLRRYVDPYVVFDLMQCWNEMRCRPPLPKADVFRIVNSLWNKESKRRGFHDG